MVDVPFKLPSMAATSRREWLMEARPGTPPYYILACLGNVKYVSVREWVCECECVLYWVLGLAVISFYISPISKFMSALVGSVIAQVEIKAQQIQCSGFSLPPHAHSVWSRTVFIITIITTRRIRIMMCIYVALNNDLIDKHHILSPCTVIQ